MTILQGLVAGVVATALTVFLVQQGWSVLYSGVLVLLAFGVVSAWCSYRHPSLRWKLATLVLAPLALLLLASLMFAGGIGSFVRHDLIVLLVAGAGSIGGAQLGSQLARRETGE